MMRPFGIAAALLICGATNANAKAVSQCTNLKAQYGSDVDAASRYQAFNQRVGSNLSSVEQSASEAKEANALARVRLDFEALRAAGCKVTVKVPSSTPYRAAANQCALDTIMSRYGGSSPVTCDPMRWKRYP